MMQSVRPDQRISRWASLWHAILLLATISCPANAAGPVSRLATQPGLQTSPETVGSACRDAAVRAEQEAGLPPGLLLAIGRQESGRWDAQYNEVLPWSYATNASGESRFFSTKAEAVSYVTQMQRSGVQSIDIGCFQINLKHHPNAFAAVEEGFDPDINARYAARFLVSLHVESGSWDTAIGRYHSGTPAFAETYKAAVLNRWNHRAEGQETTVAVNTPWQEMIAGVLVQRPHPFGSTAVVTPWTSRLPRVFTPSVQRGGNLMAVFPGRS
jgi:hypothetical protein